MIFSLDVIRAGKGDCLLLHYGTKDERGLIVIDGGPSGIYTPHLKPRLKKIRHNLAQNRKPLEIDLLMISHVDDDHIHGILDMTKDLIQDDKKFAQIFSFWHNSFDNILDNGAEEVTSAFKNQFGEASMDGSPPDLNLDIDEDEELIDSSLKVLASIKQGAQLCSDIKKLDIELNPEFDEGLISANKNTESFEMGRGLKFTVIGPMAPELDELQKKHQAWLKSLLKEGKSPEEVLSAYVDKSVPNLASIVVLAEVGDKRILLTGDARGDKILEGLELVNLIDEGGSMHVDILKVPHHGSANNLDDDFFERITADHYVFSGDGEHGNPERESLEMLLNARGNDDYTIHLTYPVGEMDKKRKEDWEKYQKKEKKKKMKNPKQKVRPDWSLKKNSLQSLFANNQDFAEKVSVIEDDDEKHIINLLEEINF